MTVVLYNAAMVMVMITPHRNPVLLVGQQQLTPYVHSRQGMRVLALPEQDVEFIRGCITPVQIGTHRPSYLNAILIQSRGRTMGLSCLACRSERPGLRPFPECRRVAEHFDGACANCKWRDHASRCFVRDEDDDVIVIGERSLGPFPGNADVGGGRAIGPGGGDGSSAQNAIVLA